MLDGVEPAWMLLSFDSMRALRQEPSVTEARPWRLRLSGQTIRPLSSLMASTMSSHFGG
jgi:hypothetical protein